MNKLLLGDNLDILKSLESESVDLIYLDPPFFSNRNYEVIWGDQGEVRSFQDRWSGGVDHYITWLKERVIEMHRVLKMTGSIFLHCDWHANAYIRVYILDKIFGENNFRNEIAWCYYGASSPHQKQFPRKHDTIFWYSKSTQWVFNADVVRIAYSDSTLKRASTTPTSIFHGKRTERTLDEKGKIPEDYWLIPPLVSTAKERIGYPTQKPESLLERIILATSNEGEVILDPFVGGGTTIAVADRLKRNWIGIDQSVQAIKVSEMRLQKQQDLYSTLFEVKLHKYDYDTLRYSNAVVFEEWIIQQYGGIPNIKKKGDKGIDGITATSLPIQVKRSDNIGRNVIGNFKSACERFDKTLFQQRKAQHQPVGIIHA